MTTIKRSLVILTVSASLIAAAGLYKKTNDDSCSDTDRFCTFDDLSQEYSEGEDWEVETRRASSGLLVSAIHGGGIEPATSQIASAIAGDRHNFYTFKGMLSSGNFENLHIDSTHFDEPEALKMVDAVNDHITIHGAEGEEPKTLIGGLNRELTEEISKQLNSSGFSVKKAPDHLSGEDPDNLVNQPKSERGVQLEITEAQRESFYKNGDISFSSRNDASNQTSAFDDYVGAVKAAIDDES
ncbi:poly-gamma-glutamate hydrolase family protein [Halobacillus sp. A1]|uniref:poly-gamma-glutamate hydrolase family protein n=1 Tax=Halobacillus sp. A1 TaxID=2880262 RepID=UPI0020A68FD8|nr:poly-gamma-glutamate hydrolase family protein [Halobacillus sp. A1]MCP3031593.1 poly-gamma-glutamate hydrolase family protein [Halobacillus sp. A1]